MIFLRFASDSILLILVLLLVFSLIFFCTQSIIHLTIIAHSHGSEILADEYLKSTIPFVYYTLVPALISLLVILAYLFKVLFANLNRSGDDNIEKDIKSEDDETTHQIHQDFYNSAYYYIGNYPIWKAQQEFRYLILSLKSDETVYAHHFHNLDNYLSKIIAEVEKIQKLHPVSDSTWDSAERLAEAKGDHLLEEIRQKHPSFKDYNLS